jgi:hypothetical protein
MLFLVFFCDFCIYFFPCIILDLPIETWRFWQPFRQSTGWVVIGSPVATLREDIIKLEKMDLRSHMRGKIWQEFRLLGNVTSFGSCKYHGWIGWCHLCLSPPNLLFGHHLINFSFLHWSSVLRQCDLLTESYAPLQWLFFLVGNFHILAIKESKYFSIF